jgi:hypothetical protein
LIEEVSDDEKLRYEKGTDMKVGSIGAGNVGSGAEAAPVAANEPAGALSTVG